MREQITQTDSDDALALLLDELEVCTDGEEFRLRTVAALKQLYELTRRRGVLSNSDIIHGLKSGEVVITDFEPAHLNGSSYDVTLGEYFYVTDKDEKSLHILNSRSESSISAHFKGPLEAMPNAEYCAKKGLVPFKEIGEDEKIIVLEPGERILAHTNEFIGARGNITTQMQSRSSAGRLGIATCFCAGWGDPGFVNRWTMEIYNLNKEPAVLVVGDRVSQIIFTHTGPVEGEYSTMSGNYQSLPASELEQIQATWSPEQMLPKPLGKQRG